MVSRHTVTLLALLSLSGCATIVGGGSAQPVAIRSTPNSASFTVTSSSGLQMAQGTTPQTIRLPRKNEYQVEFTAPGFQPQKVVLSRGTNGWIWGNLIFGWIVGFAIDFATGSAYKVEPALVEIALVESRTASGEEQTSAVVRMLDGKGRVISEAEVPLIPQQATQ
ncbi:MAG: hypothetical protein ACYC2K_11850 [Gemmatimonadales bacterium]